MPTKKSPLHQNAMSKLHEILAVESDREASLTAIHQETLHTLDKKPDHFIAKHTIYKPFDENSQEGEEVVKAMVTTVHDKLDHYRKIMGAALDLSATKDVTNCKASAPIILDGVEITPALPAITLLSLESRIKRIMEVLMAIPTLAPGRHWELDPSRGAGVFVDKNPDDKFRTKKVIRHKILVEPTQHHPAQVEKWTEDERIGKLTETTWCSMITPADKSKLIENAQNLLAAVKQARQRANAQEVEQVKIADAIFKAILG